MNLSYLSVFSLAMIMPLSFTGCTTPMTQSNTKDIKSETHKRQDGVEASENSVLKNTKWQLKSMQGVSSWRSVLTPTLEISSEFQFYGFSGCNRYHGMLKFVGAKAGVDFAPLAQTRMACMDTDANEVEMRFTELLLSAKSYEIVGQTLVLKDAKNNTVLVFVPTK